MSNSKDNKTVFDPFKRVKKTAPSAKEIERVERQTLRDLASIGAENAIPVLARMLGAFLWSEHLPPGGPDFDDFIGELARTLSMQIERLDSGLTKGHRHAWH